MKKGRWEGPTTHTGEWFPTKWACLEDGWYRIVLMYMKISVYGEIAWFASAMFQPRILHDMSSSFAECARFSRLLGCSGALTNLLHWLCCKWGKKGNSNQKTQGDTRDRCSRCALSCHCGLSRATLVPPPLISHCNPWTCTLLLFVKINTMQFTLLSLEKLIRWPW